MSKNYILGIDTSCYTTSIAIVDNSKKLIFDNRIMLEIKMGNKGLRQSEAVFQHVKNLPELFENISNKVDVKRINKICVSATPRNIEESYMPVFIAGVSFGKTLASILNVDYQEYSHQEGHIEAAKWSSETINHNSFLVVHISGGTTEILKVRKKFKGYSIDIVGGTKDISAGQLIDRTGVLMGLKFPAGKELEKIAFDGQVDKVGFPISVKGSYINYSGIETYVKRLIESRKKNDADIAISLFDSIGESLYRVIVNTCNKEKTNQVLLVGGVASNSLIRKKLRTKLKQNSIVLHNGKPEYCRDNAVGTALLGY